MSVGMMTRELPRKLLPPRLELQRQVESVTHRQVCDLGIDYEGSRVMLTGRSRTYYVKQLATHAVLSAYPEVRLENRILVSAG